MIKKLVNDVKKGTVSLVDDDDFESRQPTLEDNALDKLKQMLLEITTIANSKVDVIISPSEKPHWMGVSDALSRKHQLWLEECLAADIESRMPDEVIYPPLTFEEHQIWFSLSLVQISTCAVREAAMAISAILNSMSVTEILALPSDWMSTHELWPQ